MPLASYLKALGILRLVSEQKDSACRGAWRNDRFVLASCLSREELESFFLKEYRPNAVFNPWGGRSGFYPSKSETTSRELLERIVESKEERFADFKSDVGTVQKALEIHDNRKPKDGEEQYVLLSEIHNTLRGAGANWIPTCAPLGPDANTSYKPPIFGTGGNEGSGSYTSAFYKAVVECLLDRKWDEGLSETLWNALSQSLWKGNFGQFVPDSNGNAWDLLLAFEGAQIVRSNVARCLASLRSSVLSSPFSVSSGATGVGSLASNDENIIQKGKTFEGRGEQWFPLWKTWATCPEVRALFDEGRISSKKMKPTPLDLASAISRSAVPKGIDSFIRYGYLQRRNCATHFAVPLGRIPVVARPRSRLIDNISTWMDRLHKEARSRTASARIVVAERALSDAAFDALTHDESPSRWQKVLLALVEVERLQASGTARGIGPIPRLSPEWLVACDDGSAEYRLARALGSAAARFSESGYPVDSIRGHFLPFDKNGRKLEKEENGRNVRVVAHGRRPMEDLTAILERRTVESGQKEGRHPQIKAAPGAGALLSDLSLWIDGRVDPFRCVNLARAFMALDWRRWSPSDNGTALSPSRDFPSDAWCVLRLSALAWPLDRDLDIPFDPAIVRRLKAGDGIEAVRLALRRLNAHGVRPALKHTVADRHTALRWSSALVFPIHKRTAERLLKQIQP